MLRPYSGLPLDPIQQSDHGHAERVVGLHVDEHVGQVPGVLPFVELMDEISSGRVSQTSSVSEPKRDASPPPDTALRPG